MLWQFCCTRMADCASKVALAQRPGTSTLRRPRGSIERYGISWKASGAKYGERPSRSW